MTSTAALDSARLIIDRAMTHTVGSVDDCYVAHSGGKDSAALVHILATHCGPVHAIHCDDELTLPEHDAFLQNSRIDRWLAPALGTIHAGWHHPWRDDPRWREPLAPDIEWASSHYWSIEEYMSQQGFGVAFLGRRRHESLRRGAIMKSAGARMHRTADILVCDPLRDWTDDDLWGYLRKHRIPVCRAYRTLLRHCGRSFHSARLGPLPLMPPGGTVARMARYSSPRSKDLRQPMDAACTTGPPALDRQGTMDRGDDMNKDKCPRCDHKTDRPAIPGYPSPRTCKVCWSKDTWLSSRWPGGGSARA